MKRALALGLLVLSFGSLARADMENMKGMRCGTVQHADDRKLWTDDPNVGTFMSGNVLYNDCATSQGTCLGFVIGVADILAEQATSDSCTPAHATAQELVDTVRKFLSDNPQMRHFSAAVLVAIALGEAFPCKSAAQAKTPPG